MRISDWSSDVCSSDLADSIDLRLAILTKLEDALQFLGEMAAGALGEEGVFAVQLHAGLVIGLVGAIAGDAHVAGGDALHRAIVVAQYLGSRAAGEDIDSQRLRQPGQPAADIAERSRIGALVFHEWRPPHVP